MIKSVAIVLALLVIGFGLVFLFPRESDTTTQTSTDRTSREVALDCTTDMATKFHIHPTITIVVNGENQVVPADIGIRGGCMNALHTHDMSGLVHVEAPERRDFTLGDFFAVWEQPFSRNEILSYATDEERQIRVTINGIDVETYEETVLTDKAAIVITYEQK